MNAQILPVLLLIGLIVGPGCSSDSPTKPDAKIAVDTIATDSAVADTSVSDTTVTKDTSAVDSTVADTSAKDAIVSDSPNPQKRLFLENPCKKNALLVTPDKGEIGHLAAVRLTPPSYPYTVTGVRYVLAEQKTCKSSLAHRVEIYVSNKTVPDANPTGTTTIQVPAATTGSPERWSS